MPATRNKTERKPTLSPTKIRTYLECAVKYRYVYVDKIGRFYLRAHSYYSFGSTLHHVLQDFHEQGAAHTPEELTAELEQKWVSAGYETTEQEQQHRETGQQIVTAYHAAHQERVVAAVETLFTEKTITADLGFFKLTGRVDRIDRHPDGRLEIIDYKSGRWEVTAEQVAADLAMNCYQLILQKLYPDAPVFATIYCLRSGLSASAQMSSTEREEFERDVLALGSEIITQDYMALKPVLHEPCPDCEFLPVCSRYWKQQERAERLDMPHSEDGI